MGNNEFTSYDARRRGLIGLGLALVSAATFGTAGTFADSLMAAGWSPGAVVSARVWLAALFLTPVAMLQLRGRWLLLRRSASSVLAFGVVAVAGCQLFFFNAVQRLTVGVALLLEYLGIVLVVLWLWARHGQRPRRLTVTGMVAAIAGLLLVLNPQGGRLDPIGVCWALVAAAGLAVYFVLSAHTGDALPPLALAWAGLLVGGLCLAVFDLTGLLPARIGSDTVTLHGQRLSWLVPVLGLSLLAAAIAYSAGIGGVRLLGARLASFVGLTEVLFATAIAALVLGQVPSGWQLLGGLVVLLGVTLVRTGETAPSTTPAARSEVHESEELVKPVPAA